MEREQERVHVGGSPTRCPWCKGEIEDVKQVVACAACGARHHGACHSEHGRCATCSSEDVLVPRAAAAPSKARVQREEPPAGSRIKVTRDGEALVYSWPGRDTAALLVGLVWLFALPPLGLYMLWLYLTIRERTIRVAGDEIELTVGTFRGKRLRAKRAEVGAIRVATSQQQTNLSIDVGMDRYFVKTGIMNPALRGPEVEWLAKAIEAWKDEA